MQAAKIYLEYPNPALDMTFTYLTGDLPVVKGIRVNVPFGHTQSVGFVDEVFEIGDLYEYEKNEGFKLKEITNIIDEKPLLNEELLELGKWLAKDTITPVIACYQAMLPKALKPNSGKHSVVKETWLHYECEPEKLTIKQQELLNKVKEKDLKKNELTKISASITKRLIELKALSEYEKDRSASLSIDGKGKELLLTSSQQEVKAAIEQGKQGEVFLLRGVTGSGKTEVYLQLAAEYLAKGQQVLILVPEISLTPQMMERVRNRFAQAVAIYHSGLNEQEKYEQYRLVSSNKVNIVVGTRSAIFMPFTNLGLIVLDEEHDQSYKQASSPRYHCRDVALWRAKWHQAKVVLGSATPSLESYSRAVKNVYTLVQLPQRISGDLALTHIIDMTKENRKGNTVLSQKLEEAIKDRLAKKEQVIILLNRRGYSPVLRCQDCGEVIKCPHCDVPMCYHKSENLLKCHVCGTTLPPDQTCEKCGGHQFTDSGLGTERLESILQLKFPQARVLRLDADTSQVKNAHQRILKAFEKGEADILIGTQMIAKGLDYPNVTLVGIINADALLNRVDYRAVEMTFDLLVQASGRSGRSNKGGEVYIQVYNPRHYGIRLAAAQDYLNFFKQEMHYRHLGNYPPYSYFISFISQDKDENNAYNNSRSIKEWFAANGVTDILGPADILKRQDYYRYRLLYRGKDLTKMKELVNKLYEYRRENKQNDRLIIDVNPWGIDE